MIEYSQMLNCGWFEVILHRWKGEKLKQCDVYKKSESMRCICVGSWSLTHMVINDLSLQKEINLA